MSVSIRAHPGEGIKRSEEVPADVSITNKVGRKLLVMMALVAGVAGSLLVWQIVRRSPAAGSATPATSISMAAVPLKSTAGLPAVSQSEDKPMYFADCTQDDPLREGSALPKNFAGSESKTIYN